MVIPSLPTSCRYVMAATMSISTENGMLCFQAFLDIVVEIITCIIITKQVF